MRKSSHLRPLGHSRSGDAVRYHWQKCTFSNWHCPSYHNVTLHLHTCVGCPLKKSVAGECWLMRVRVLSGHVGGSCCVAATSQ
jgi:hypothetical protein